MCDASFSRCLLHADDSLQNANISQALHYFGIHMNCECMPESCAVHCNHRLFVLGYYVVSLIVSAHVRCYSFDIFSTKLF